MIPTPLVIIIELARVETVEDPFAFRFAPQDYLVRAEGGGFSRIRLEWDRAWLDDLAALSDPGRPPELLQRIGERLREFLEGAGWAAKAAAIEGVVRAGGSVLVSVRSAAAELYTLPWELTTLGPSGAHLAELEGVLLRYEWPESTSVPERDAPRRADGRILVAWSAAAGAVPASEHVDAIAEACAAGGRPFDRDRDVLAHTSPAKLEEALASALDRGPPVDVLHILCHAHGGPDGGLLLDSDRGGGVTTLDPGSLRRLLRRFAGMVRLVVFAACESADPGAAANTLGSLTQVLHRAGVAAVIGARLPLAVSTSIIFTRALYRGLASSMMSLEAAMVHARRRLATEPGDLGWATLQLYSRASDGDDTRPLVVRPYRGLLAFQPEHRRLLFGRDREMQEIRGDLRTLEQGGAPRFLVVAGASGTGKSSVVFGGFIPLLAAEAEPRWTWERLRPGADPLRALATTTGRLTGAAVDASAPAIGEALLGWRRAHPDRSLLLVVDQFEEIITQAQDPADKRAFVRLLWQLAADKHHPITVLLTIRVDFVGHCGEFTLDEAGLRLDRVAYDERHRIFVARGDRRAYREIIEAPAAAVGLSFETGLVERMLDDVEGEPGALPLLGHALNLLWEHRSGRVLTLAVYREIGELSGALGRYADGIITALSDEEQVQARRLLVRLVSTGRGALDTRARLPVALMRPKGDAAPVYDRVVERLTDHRLLVTSSSDDADGAAGATMIEVSHEALLRGWPRLQGWVDEDHARIRDLGRIDAWVVDFKERGTILDAARLSFAEETARLYADDISDHARELLTASIQARVAREAREAQHRAALEASLLRAKKTSVLVGLAALLALFFGVFAADAVEELEVESKRQLDNPLLELLDRIPLSEFRARIAVLASVAAPQGRPEWIVAANTTLATLPEQQLLGRRGEGAPFETIEVSPDGSWILQHGQGDVAAYEVIVDEDRPALVEPTRPPMAPDVLTATMTDEHTALLVVGDGSLISWDPDDTVPLPQPRATVHGAAPIIATYDTQLAIAEAQIIRVVDLKGAHEEIHLRSPSGQPTALRFADAGESLLAITATEHSVDFWSLSRPTAPQRFVSEVGTPLTTAIGGGRLLAVTDAGRIITWSLEQPDTPPTIVELDRAPLRVAALDDRATRALIATDTYLGIEPITGEDSVALPGLAGPVVSAAWSPSGERVFASDRLELRAFWADGRRFNLSGATDVERVRTVWELASCPDRAQLRSLFTRYDLGELLHTVDAAACSENLRRGRPKPEQISANLIFFTLFVLELAVLIARLIRQRRAIGPAPQGRILVDRLIALAIFAAAILGAMESIDSSLGRAVGQHQAGSFIIALLATVWLINAARRLREPIATTDRRRRIALRSAQALLLAPAAVLVVVMLSMIRDIADEITLFDTVDIDEATKAMFFVLTTLVTALFVLGLRRADKVHAAAAAPPPEAAPAAPPPPEA